jgi:hypothetical protein
MPVYRDIDGHVGKNVTRSADEFADRGGNVAFVVIEQPVPQFGLDA